MFKDHLVIDAVAHAYDLSDANTEGHRYAQTMRMQLCGLHQGWQPEIGLTPEEQCSDWPIEVMARTLFLESDVDLAVTHTLRLNSYFKDGLCARYKTVEAAVKELHRHRGEFPTLYVTTSESFGALDEAAMRATDEIALRPVTADSLRWRVEAMVVRSSGRSSSRQMTSWFNSSARPGPTPS